MSKTATKIDAILAQGRPALIAYLPAGFPSVEKSIEAAHVLIESGVDIIELGLPYSDPVMDGPTIQAAVDIALDAGVKTQDVFTVVRAVAATGTPTLVMTYFNPVLRYGVDRFAADLAEAGGAGLITADLIPDEAHEWISAADRYDLDKVFLVAPSSTDARLAMTAKASRGFVYAASTMGVTGVRASVGEQAENLVSRTRDAGADRVCVGLGVSQPDQAAEVGRYSDGVIVGSAFVRTLLAEGEWSDRLDNLRAVAMGLAEGVRSARNEATL